MEKDRIDEKASFLQWTINDSIVRISVSPERPIPKISLLIISPNLFIELPLTEAMMDNMIEQIKERGEYTLRRIEELNGKTTQDKEGME